MSLSEAQLIEVCDRLNVPKRHPQEIVFLKEYSVVLKPLANAITFARAKRTVSLAFWYPQFSA